MNVLSNTLSGYMDASYINKNNAGYGWTSTVYVASPTDTLSMYETRSADGSKDTAMALGTTSQRWYGLTMRCMTK